MLVKCEIKRFDDDKNTSHSVTLVPRLDYSLNLLDEITGILSKRINAIKRSNEDLTAEFDETDKTHLASIRLEQTLLFSLEVLSQTKRQMAQISGINSIPEVLPSSIPMIRTVCAQLYDVIPQCSRRLSELSVHLGSIALDSAVITKARLDFGLSNEESATLLNKVKLMVDSKLSKQYPNLDFFKISSTWQY